MTEQTQPEKLDLRSQDIAAEQREKLRQLFPEVITEDGKVDFDRLKTTLGEIVDNGKERYGMNWPGKAECFRTIQMPSRATLRPCREESVNFDTTENLIIEGDNLEVLKLLQKGYLGKVKMIYIDPPYNTGNDFIYPDNYSENLDTYLSYTGQVDAEGRKFSTNPDTDGRFHSKWLNMMYPRMFLARNLLREDGVIFISIDDTEFDNLRKLCNEIFGEESFIAAVTWQKIYSGKADATHFGRFHEYILCIAKNVSSAQIHLLPRTAEMDARYSNPDDDPRGVWLSNDLTAAGERSAGHFDVKSPTGATFDSPQGKHWLYSEVTMTRLLAENRIWFGKHGTAFPRLKRFLTEVQQGRRASTVWIHNEVGSTDEGTKELRTLFPELQGDFQTPKPVRLIKQMLQIATTKDTDDIVVDFFAGSGTTAEAVFQANEEDGGRRKVILVQLPERTERADFPTIADITKERVRRVIKELNNEDVDKLDLERVAKSDRGFRAFKLDSSNFKPWDGTQTDTPEGVTNQLELHVDHVLPDRSQEDILTELLLKSGFPLSTKIEATQLAGKQVFSVEGGTMLVCLDGNLTPEVIKAMADMKPSRVICLDDGFQGNDQLKTNAVQTMKARGVLSFRTV